MNDQGPQPSPHAGICLLEIMRFANDQITENIWQINKAIWDDEHDQDNFELFPKIRIPAVELSAVEAYTENPPNGGRERDSNDLA